MTSVTDNQKISAGKSKSFLFYGSVRLAAATILVLSAVGWFGHSVIKEEMQQAITEQLVAALGANAEVLSAWIEQKRSDVKVWAADRDVIKDVSALLELAEREGHSPEVLLNSQELIRLRQRLGPVCKEYGYIGFVLFDLDGNQIGALLDKPVGKRILVQRSDFVQRSINGETVVSLPFPGETPLPVTSEEKDQPTQWKLNWPTMFASTPVKDSQGDIIAALSFRIRPETEFTQILSVSRFGHSGESYAFNADGLMISDSRFNDQLREMGFIPGEKDSRAILTIQVRDPGRHPDQNTGAALPPMEKRPFTKMAKSAIGGAAGLDVDGYNDYRGVPVVGTWTWMGAYGFGLAVEMDVAEAYQPLITLRRIFLGVYVFLLLAVAIALVLRMKQNRMDQEALKTEAELKAGREKYKTIFNQLRTIVEATASATGEHFFRSLVYQLARGLNVHYAFVGELADPDSCQMQTLALWGGAEFSEPFEYDITGTPCEKAMAGELCYFPQGVQELFPKDRHLGEMGIEGYLGISLYSSKGGRIGILSVMDTEPMDPDEKENFQSILKIFAARAEMELERIRVDEVLRSSEERTRSVIANAVDGIVTIHEDGTIDSFNLAAEKIFGYSTKEVIGKKVDLLMPEPYQSEHDQYLKTYLRTGQAKIMGVSREELGLRKDGSVFDIGLSVSEMYIEGKRMFMGIISDITERKNSQRRENQLHRKNELILTSVGEGIFGLDREGHFTFMNPSASEMFGYSHKELIGKPVLIVLTPANTPIPEDYAENIPIFSTLKNYISCKVPLEIFWKKDGSRFPAEYMATSMWEEGQIIGAVVTFRNISERLNTERDMKRYAASLEKINRELNDFTYIASHDLQEPLRKVMTLGDRLLMTNFDNLNEQGKTYITRMQESTERMQNLIYDLLDYSKTTSEDYEYKPTDLREEIANVITNLEMELEASKGKVVVNDLPIIEASGFQMRQLFQNLIGNALKFKKSGLPPVVSISSRKAENGFWEISIKDNGIGFEEKYADRIFKPFQRLHRYSDVKGSGIGLAICIKIVNIHGGKIVVKSKLGEGTTFLVSLPEKQGAQQLE